MTTIAKKQLLASPLEAEVSRSDRGGTRVFATPPTGPSGHLPLTEGGEVVRLTLRTADDLSGAGIVRDDQRAEIARVGARYAIAITPAMTELIRGTDANDPIARQFIPDARELDTNPRELADPIGDDAKSPVPGIVHRYRNRLLLKIASVCPVYCRFCFRREMVGPDLGHALSGAELAGALDYIRAQHDVREVIFTGGDPLVLSPRRIAEATTAVASIAHVEILRWHTRVPVVAPERVTDDLVQSLTSTQKRVVVALHTNHPRELTSDARAAIERLRQAGVALLSQTVLLKGINDDCDTLEELLHAFAELGITPYYLHHGDLAPGTAHFRTTITQGLALMDELRRRLPASALPRYVLDIPGGHGKVDIGTHVKAIAKGRYRVRDAKGALHHYEDATG